MKTKLSIALVAAITGGAALLIAVFGVSGSSTALADDDDDDNGAACDGLPSHGELTAELEAVVALGGAGAPAPNNAGLGNDMWATVVNRDGEVCSLARSGDDRGDQWPGSRVISAQKANTANAFSLPGGGIGFSAPLSTAQLWTAVQPGGSLFGLQFSNPVDTDVAYEGSAKKYGNKNDPMVGGKIGGVNVFGGGLALYDSSGTLLGAIGVSGDTSCADHFIGWRVRHALNLDNVPGGVAPGGTDNIIFAPATALQAAFAHPNCLFAAAEAATLAALPPVGPAP